MTSIAVARLEEFSRRCLRDDYDTALDELRNTAGEMLDGLTHLVECREQLRAELVAYQQAHVAACTDPEECEDAAHDDDDHVCNEDPTAECEIKAWTDGVDRGGRWDTHSITQLFATIDECLARLELFA